MSEFRQDPLTGRWVILASDRAHRPRQLGSSSKKPGAEPCPFCRGNEAMTPPELWAERSKRSVANSPDWMVRVVPNKYPALRERGEPKLCDDPFYASRPGLGAHEVIIESPHHDISLAALDEKQFKRIARAYRLRLQSISQDHRWRYMLLYKNQGEYAGATLEHVHSQLIAMPTMPAEAAEELHRAQEHYQRMGSCIYCAIIEREISLGERVVFINRDFVALCPFAPRFAYETWLLPKTHAPAFVDAPEAMLEAFARTLHEILTRMRVVLGDLPFNYIMHSLALDAGVERAYHWQLRILPQLARAAGFEWGSGAHINAVTPEAAAQLLRGAVV